MIRRVYKLIVVMSLLCGSVDCYGFSGHIDTPDECYMVGSIASNTVNLVKSGIKCTGSPGRAFIKESSSKTVSVRVDNTYWNKQKLQQTSVQDVTALLKTSQDVEKNLQANASSNPYDSVMAEAARSASGFANSEHFLGQVDKEKQRIMGLLVKEAEGVRKEEGDPENYYGDVPVAKKRLKLRSDERLYLFVSSSMPSEVIREYMADIDLLGYDSVAVVLRGFIGGMKKVQPTMQFVGDILKKDKFCSGANCEIRKTSFIIDPLLFRKYKIERVPAVVYASGLEFDDDKASEGRNENVKKSGSFFVAYGDANIEYLIRQIQRESGGKVLDD